MPDKGQKKQIDQCFDYKKNILFYVFITDYNSYKCF